MADSSYIPYSTQDIDESDIRAVVAVLNEPFLTQGPMIGEFEQSMCNYCSATHAVAVANATAGLHITLLALEIGAGDRVWTTPMTFLSSANVALMVGADIDFVDVEPATGNICVSALKVKLEEASTQGKLPSAIIVVHFGGRVCNMPAIWMLASAYGVQVIEDAAHALGSVYEDGTAVGSRSESVATVFSFHPVKAITSGEGGIVATNNAEVANKLKMLRSHGVTRDKQLFTSGSDVATGDWYYEQQMLGYNYRLTDIQAALGNSQLRRLNEFIGKRRAIARRYRAMLNELPIDLPPEDESSAWHLYPVRLKLDTASRDTVFARMRAANIGVNVHYIPVHLQPFYSRLGFRRGMFPMSEQLYARSLSIPLFPKLTEAQQARVCAELSDALFG